MNAQRYTPTNEEYYREIIDGVLQVEIPKRNGVARWWHSNGRLAREMTKVNGVPEGIVREWHENGRLMRETPYKHGLVDGVVRQWSADGRLLGTYELHRGMGTTREWHEDGSLQSEIAVLAPGCHWGRVWDERGRSHEVFLWDSHPVSKEQFMARVRMKDLAA